ncbi:hypothetical protein BKA56DRAFT_675645 [Ilyonectria sp. MPI-CAGE-AT-0026]|nr:hypothetical protein BKA56DRAFT_675645 [Ilyonectria sp. MPI-CAGE-AT-0026]
MIAMAAAKGKFVIQRQESLDQKERASEVPSSGVESNAASEPASEDAQTAKESKASATSAVASESDSSDIASDAPKSSATLESSARASSEVVQSSDAASTQQISTTIASSTKATSTSKKASTKATLTAASSTESSVTTGEIWSGAACFSTSKKSTSYCKITTSGSHTITASLCTPTHYLSSTCSPGLICTTNIGRENICMHVKSIETSGAIIGITFLIVFVLGCAGICFASFKQSRARKRHEIEAEARAESRRLLEKQAAVQ